MKIFFFLFQFANMFIFRQAALSFFSNPGNSRGFNQFKILFAVSAFGSLACIVYFPMASPLSLSIAGLCLCASIALFFATLRAAKGTDFRVVFADHSSASVLQTGPFSRVRHPFYVSYLLSFFGAACVTQSPIAWVIFAIMLQVYDRAARKEEKSFLSGEQAEVYAAFIKRTHRFLPGVY